jgi:hypothetical protein
VRDLKVKMGISSAGMKGGDGDLNDKNANREHSSCFSSKEPLTTHTKQQAAQVGNTALHVLAVKAGAPSPAPRERKGGEEQSE